MENPADRKVDIDGKLIAILLDLDEYPSNVGEVAVVSDQQLMVIRRDRDELVGFKPAYLDVSDCRSIEYIRETAWYRIILAAIGLALAVVLAVMLFQSVGNSTDEITPLIIGTIMLVTFGIRFATSTHRHLIRFEMADEVLEWESPPIDFNSKAADARAVREFARSRGILKGNDDK
jgi:hypothetical protein